jgi:hypothetical protein
MLRLKLKLDTIDHGEGTYIEFSSGDTMIHFGQDGFTNLDDSATPTTGAALDTIADIVNTAYTRNPTSPYTSAGLGIAQKTPFGTISALYVPQVGDNGKGTATADHKAEDIDGKAAYEVKFKGNLRYRWSKCCCWYERQKVRQRMTV